MERIKRRTFIKNTVIAGAGFALIPDILLAEEKSSAVSKKVIVAGAGITGLCCAYEIMKSGHEVVVLEASGRYGGHVFTGSDGLSDGLYADFGADHITKPGYERLFEHAQEFNIPAIPYPNAEGSWLPYDNNGLKMIGGKFYTNKMLADPKVLTGFGFNNREVAFLSTNPWYELEALYLGHYLDKF